MTTLSEIDTVGSEIDTVEDVAVILLDRAEVVQWWSPAATELLGHTAAQVRGQPIETLLVDPPEWNHADREIRSVLVPGKKVRIRDKSGRSVELTVEIVPMDESFAIALLAAPASVAGQREWAAEFLRALLAQNHVGVVLHDTELRITRTNVTSKVLGGGALMEGRSLDEFVFSKDEDEVEGKLREVLETGVPVFAWEHGIRGLDGDRLASLSAFRLEDGRGRPTGVAVLLVDDTEQRRARLRTELGHQASARIGVSLDVAHTAQDIADVLVPALGELAMVDIAEPVLEGDEPPKGYAPELEWHMRRVAVASADESWPTGVITVGDAVPPLPDLSPVRWAFLHGETYHSTSRQEMLDQLRDPELARVTLPEAAHSAIVSPLLARGLSLGFVTVFRTRRPEPFAQEDVELVTDIASRAALSIDNARRYTREHQAAVALQQRLLPKNITAATAADTAGAYVPAGGGADISGDWFDVIPLPSLRVAFVVGDVIGHGLHAAATMGRLRAAIRTLADLELEPGELLIHLDDLVQQLAAEAAPKDQDGIGATCLYALYDPLTGTCAMADAGHPPPLAVRPDGTGHLIEVSPGPPLGVGGMPFEVTTVTLEPDTVLALYTDGLVERGSGDVDQGTGDLREALVSHSRGERGLEDIGRAVMAEAAKSPPRDDMALLLARTHRLSSADTAEWRFSDDRAVVAEARHVVLRQLSEWDLEDLAFSTELIVSELLTNAIRHAGGSVGLHLLRDENTLVCEVTDTSNTQPRLRRASAGDEGGRGLFLVAQLARRWGSRYHRSGKTVWAEQSTHAAPSVDLAAVWDDASL